MTDNSKPKIQSAYNAVSHSYDEMITLRKWWARLGVKLVWGFPDTAYSDSLLSRIPDYFSGALLDIPAGTGALTAEFYRSLTAAEIICADYSEGMLSVAKERLRAHENVSFRQADVGDLPFDSSAFDIVLTMNGLHAFPDKEAAFKELRRVLKPNGMLIGCCYIRGRVKRTDWVVRNIYEPRGFFTPPFLTETELKTKLQLLFTRVKLWTLGAIAMFQCQ